MILTDLGNNAQHCWDEKPKHFPFVELINFVVMPNHVHGLLYLRGGNENMDDSEDGSKIANRFRLETTGLYQK